MGAIQPEDWRYLYAGVVTGHEALGPILGELRRKLSEDPGCARARPWHPGWLTNPVTGTASTAQA